MIRLSKMSDYGVVLLTYMAQNPTDDPHTSRQLARASKLPLPTVSKVLKAFARAGVLDASRGKQGGYSLRRDPGELSVAEILAAVDGPLALVDCATHSIKDCDIEASCPVKRHQYLITNTVRQALESLTLDRIVAPAPPLSFGAGALPVMGPA